MDNQTLLPDIWNNQTFRIIDQRSNIIKSKPTKQTAYIWSVTTMMMYWEIERDWYHRSICIFKRYYSSICIFKRHHNLICILNTYNSSISMLKSYISSICIFKRNTIIQLAYVLKDTTIQFADSKDTIIQFAYSPDTTVQFAYSKYTLVQFAYSKDTIVQLAYLKDSLIQFACSKYFCLEYANWIMVSFDIIFKLLFNYSTNILWISDVNWLHGSWSALIQVIVCCLNVSSNQVFTSTMYTSALKGQENPFILNVIN